MADQPDSAFGGRGRLPFHRGADRGVRAALHDATGLGSLPAVFTNAVDLEGVAGSFVVVFVADLLPESFDFGGEELDRTAATGADHVVVAAAVVLMFVAGDAVMKGDFAGEATLGEQLQRAVDGRVTDLGVFLFDQAVQFFGGKVLTGLEEGAQDGIALRGLLEADALEMLVEDVLGFADHLAGDGGLVIDALLQHEWVEASRSRAGTG